jgi:hypothetical protein
MSMAPRSQRISLVFDDYSSLGECRQKQTGMALSRENDPGVLVSGPILLKGLKAAGIVRVWPTSRTRRSETASPALVRADARPVRAQWRERLQRNPSPTAAVLDAQSTGKPGAVQQMNLPTET